MPADLGFTNGYDSLGRPQRVNLQTITSYLAEPKNILAVDRLALPETNRLMPPFPHQRILFKEAALRQFLFLQMMRGGAKTSSLARFAVDWALISPQPIIFTGPSFKQSLMLFDECLSIIAREERNENSPLRLTTELVGDPKRNSIDALIRFATGASIRALPMGDGCLTADTLVMRADGFGSISDCFDPAFAGKATAVRSETIWTPSGYRQSDEAYANGEQPTIRVTTKRGYTIEGTANHGLRDAQGQWKRLDELTVGDSLTIDATPAWHSGSIEATTDECYALGLLVGDGCWTSQYKVGFSTKDRALAEAVQVLLPGLSPAKDGVHWNANGKNETRSLRERFDLKPASTRDKCFPTAILRSSQEQCSAFIQGLFDSDGTIQYAPGKTTTAGFANTSETLVRQLHTILTHFGIASTIRRRDRSERWEVSYELLITGSDLRKFHEQIGFRLERKRSVLEAAMSDGRRRHVRKTNTFSDTVVSLETSYAPTFDVHVPDGNEYRANGFHSHNSKIRGYRGGVLIIDEAYQITEEMYSSHLAPFAGVRMGGRPSKIILSTTSWYQDTFMYRRLLQICSEIKAGNPVYGFLDFNLQDLVRTSFPLEEAIWKDAKRHGGGAYFAMTYFNIWPRSTARWYIQDVIDKAISPVHGVEVERERAEPDDVYYAVFDLASSEIGDSTFATVYKYENGQSKDVFAHEERGLDPNERAWLAHELDRKFDFTYIVYDAHGAIGQDFRKVLAQDTITVNGVTHEVTPLIHHDANNLRGKQKLVPVAVNDLVVRNALIGPRDGTSIRGEAGLKNQLHTKLRDMLLDGKLIGPSQGKDEVKNTVHRGTDGKLTTGTDHEVVDTIRKSFMQLAGIGLAKDKQGNQIFTADGQLVFETRAGLHDDGAYCHVYATIAHLALESRLDKSKLRDRPRTAPLLVRQPYSANDLYVPEENIQRIIIA